MKVLFNDKWYSKSLNLILMFQIHRPYYKSSTESWWSYSLSLWANSTGRPKEGIQTPSPGIMKQQYHCALSHWAARQIHVSKCAKLRRLTSLCISTRSPLQYHFFKQAQYRHLCGKRMWEKQYSPKSSQLGKMCPFLNGETNHRWQVTWSGS